MLRGLAGPVILADDFNAAPWSHAVAKVAEASRTKMVPGIRMTIDVNAIPWLPSVPIPIDHALLCLMNFVRHPRVSCRRSDRITIRFLSKSAEPVAARMTHAPRAHTIEFFYPSRVAASIAWPILQDETSAFLLV